MLIWMWTYETHVKPPVIHQQVEGAFWNRRFCDGLPPRFSPAEEAQQPWGPRAAPTDLLYNPISSPRHVYDPSAVLNIRTVMAQRIAAHVRAPNPRPAPDLSGYDRSLGFPEDYNATGGGLPDGLPEAVKRFLGLRYWSHVLPVAVLRLVRICDHKHCLRTARPSRRRAPRTRRVCGDYWSLPSRASKTNPRKWPTGRRTCATAPRLASRRGREFLSRCAAAASRSSKRYPRRRGDAAACTATRSRAPLPRGARATGRRRLREQERAQRNDEAAACGDVRFLKHFRFAHPRIGLLSQPRLRDYRASFVDALNIDTGLLFAASIVGELPALHRQHKVVPQGPRRERLAMHRGALCRVRQLYGAQQGRPSTSDDLITSTSGTRPAWLDAVKTHAQTIF